MKSTILKHIALSISQVSTIVVLLLTAGCASTDRPATGGASTSAGTQAQSGKGGSQLWGENCGRCHNIRTPSSYSDVEWQVAMHHMRIRANLTAEEHKKILEFLKSAN